MNTYELDLTWDFEDEEDFDEIEYIAKLNARKRAIKKGLSILRHHPLEETFHTMAGNSVLAMRDI